MELTNSNSCWRDDLPLRNPNWKLERDGLIKSMILSYISLSRTFESQALIQESNIGSQALN